MRISYRRVDLGVVPLVACVLTVVGALGTAVLSLAGNKTEPATAWTKSLGGKVLWVVNASPSMFAVPASTESVLPGDAILGRIKVDERIEAFKEGSNADVVHLVETPCRLVVVVLEDRGEQVRLLAFDTETGATRWERTGIMPGKRGGFVTLGNLVLARIAQDENGKPSRSEYLLTAFDLHDGRTLWRNDEIPEVGLRFLGLPRHRVALVESIGGGGRLYAVDLDTGRIRWQLSREEHYQVLLPFTGFASGNSLDPTWAFVQTAENLFSYTAAGGEVFVLTQEGPRTKPQPVLRSVDLVTGATRWAYSLPGEKWDPAVSIFVDADRVYAYRYELFLIALDRATGAELAQWPVTGHRGWMGGRWLDPRRLYLNRDVLVVAYPGGKEFQLKALDARTGKQLWETDKLKESPAGLALVGNRIVFASGRTVVSLDLRSGAVDPEPKLRLESSLEFLIPTPDDAVVLQSTDQVAKLLVGSWKTAYDTGELPRGSGPRGEWGAGLGSGKALLDAFVSGSAWGGIAGGLGAMDAASSKASKSGRLSRARATSSLAAASPAGQSVADDLATELISTQASESTGANALASFFIARGPDGDRWVVRVDQNTGERRSLCPFESGSWRNTVVDDYHGFAVTLHKDEATAVRFAVSDATRRRAEFADAAGGGLESLRRGAALIVKKAPATAKQELERAKAQLHTALAVARGPQEAGVRLGLATACRWLADLTKEGGAELREQAKRELEAVIRLGSTTEDERLVEAGKTAAAILAELGGDAGAAPMQPPGVR